MSSIFVHCRLEDGAILPILINDKKPFPTTQRAFSDVLEQVSVENFSGGKPPKTPKSLSKKLILSYLKSASLSMIYI